MAEIGRNPISTTRFSLSMGNEQADAGRDGRTRLARLNSQARTGIRRYIFSCSADHEQDWQPYPVDPYPAILCDNHSYFLPGHFLLSKCFFELLTKICSREWAMYLIYPWSREMLTPRLTALPQSARAKKSDTQKTKVVGVKQRAKIL